MRLSRIGDSMRWRGSKPGLRSLMMCMLVVQASSLPAQSEENPPPPTLEIFQRLATTIAGRVADEVMANDSAEISLTLLPKESAWFLDRSVAQGFASRGHRTGGGAPSAISVECGVEHLSVKYEDLRRSWFLGARVVTRKVELALTFKTTPGNPGSLVQHRRVSEVGRDTVFVADLAELENPMIPATRGVLPREGFFSNMAEPVIMAGAIGVAVYLLFSIRS
jgi:hypothetical protein